MPQMKELIEAGLFDRGLVLISNQTMIDRYNACLEDMGITTTSLPSFHIDRMGWSPEVAAEQGNNYYLSHGEANPLAIVISPEQAQAPIYFPMHSFDWALMDQWFIQYKIPIADLTRESGLWLDIDNETDVYREPQDLLMVSEVHARVGCPSGLIQRAQEQQRLVRQWLAKPDSHTDAELIMELEENSRHNGDLRQRHLFIGDMPFLDMLDFYSRAFGGTFILRSGSGEPLVLIKKESRAPLSSGVQYASDDVIPRLIKYGYLATDVVWWREHLRRLEIIAESFLVEVLDRYEPDVMYEELNEVKKRQLIHKYSDKLAQYTEINRVRSALKEGRVPEVPKKVAPFLLHPPDTLSVRSREVVWQLLTYIQGGRFVPLMYRHQKTLFIEAYAKWKSPRSSWALGRIREYHDLIQETAGYDM